MNTTLNVKHPWTFRQVRGLLIGICFMWMWITLYYYQLYLSFSEIIQINCRQKCKGSVQTQIFTQKEL